MTKPKPYVVPATVVRVDSEAHHVRLTVYPEQGPSAMHPVVVLVNKVERPEWASVKPGTRVRVGIVMEEASSD